MPDFNAEAAKLAPGTSERQAGNVDNLIMETERAYNFGTPLREALLTIKDLDINSLDNLLWYKQQLYDAQEMVGAASDQKAKASMKPVREKSDLLISSVVSRARYYYRNDPDAQRQLDRIGDTAGADDRYGDLNRLATFLQAHPELLADNPDLPADAAAKAIEMASQIATQDGSAALKAAVEHRNLAYWMLHKALSEVRAAVRYRFSGQKDVIERVCGHLVKPRKKASGEETPDAPVSTTPTDPVSE